MCVCVCVRACGSWSHYEGTIVIEIVRVQGAGERGPTRYEVILKSRNIQLYESSHFNFSV